MFTGIIDHCGIIVQRIAIPSGLHIEIKSDFSDLTLGESIAVDGVCLTVTHIEKGQFGCDISPETLNITTATFFHPGQMVNLERALLPTTRLGGHFVMGHVDGIATVQKRKAHDQFLMLQFNLSQTQYLVKKGSIAVNGVSLTLNEIMPDGFTVMLIPHTADRTNLSALLVGDHVNIEFDMMARLLVDRIALYNKAVV